MGKKLERIPIEPEENLPLFDGHCHIPWNPPPNGMEHSYEAQYQLFFEKNGKFLITSSVDWDSLNILEKFTQNHANMGITIGWAPQTVTYTHPSIHDQTFSKWLEYLLAHHESFMGIGEIGLDFHHAKTLEARQRQIKVLDTILQKTKHLNKPYILHLRNPSEAEYDKDHPNHPYNKNDAVNQIMIELLTKENIDSTQVIWHCFSGPKEWGMQLAEQGFYLSVPSSAFGFKQWRSYTENIPITQLLTETDAHFQHPFSFGILNEPINVRYSIAAISYMHQLNQLEVATQILKNFEKIYKIKI